MEKIRVLSWNVEHFNETKLIEVEKIIREYDPDIFGIYEVEAPEVYTFMVDNFPQYITYITEGQQTQEILVAVKQKYEGIKFQQKTEFKSGNPYLRPGAFLTFRYPNHDLYAFLFLHTDAGTSAVDFGNRTEMFEHAYNLKRKLDSVEDKEVNFVMLGDLNTMGLQYPSEKKKDNILKPQNELSYLDYYASRKSGSSGYKKRSPNLKRLTKPEGTHFSKTYGESDLDHVIASRYMSFIPQENYSTDEKYDIRLDGWRKYTDEDDRAQYAEDISDHCLLFFEIIV